MAGRPVSEEEYHALNATIEAERAAAANEAIMRARVAQNAAMMAANPVLFSQEVQRQESLSLASSLAMEASWIQARSMQAHGGRPRMGQMAHPQVRPQPPTLDSQIGATVQEQQQQRQRQQQQHHQQKKQQKNQAGGSSGSTNPSSNSHGSNPASGFGATGVNNSSKTSLPSNAQGMIPIGFFRDPRGNAWAASLQHPTHSAPPVDANFWAIRQQQLSMGRGGVQQQVPLVMPSRKHQQQPPPHENQVIEIDSENDEDNGANMPDDASKSSCNTQSRSTQSKRSCSPQVKKTAERSELERIQQAAQVEYARMSAKRAIAQSSLNTSAASHALDPGSLPMHLTHLTEMAKRAPGTTQTYPLTSGKSQKSSSNNNSNNNNKNNNDVNKSIGGSHQSKSSKKHSAPAAASPPSKRSRSSSASSPNVFAGSAEPAIASSKNTSVSKQQETQNSTIVSDAEMKARFERARLAVAMSESKSASASSSTTGTAATTATAKIPATLAVGASTAATTNNHIPTIPTNVTTNTATTSTAVVASGKRTLLATPFIKGYLTNHTMRMADQRREVKTVVDKVLLVATGYTTDTAPSSIPFPPVQLNLDYDQLEEVALEVVQERHELVGDAVRQTYSDMKARHDEILKVEHAKQNLEEVLRNEIILLQQKHKKALTVVIKKHTAEKEEWEEKMRALQEEVAMHKAAALEHKATQTKSLETMMKASMLSLRMIRKKENVVSEGGIIQ